MLRRRCIGLHWARSARSAVSRCCGAFSLSRTSSDQAPPTARITEEAAIPSRPHRGEACGSVVSIRIRWPSFSTGCLLPLRRGHRTSAAKLFSQMVIRHRYKPTVLKQMMGSLFQCMAHGGAFGIDEIRHFKGDLFTDASALELTPARSTPSTRPPSSNGTPWTRRFSVPFSSAGARSCQTRPTRPPTTRARGYRDPRRAGRAGAACAENGPTCGRSS